LHLVVALTTGLLGREPRGIGYGEAIVPSGHWPLVRTAKKMNQKNSGRCCARCAPLRIVLRLRWRWCIPKWRAPRVCGSEEGCLRRGEETGQSRGAAGGLACAREAPLGDGEPVRRHEGERARGPHPLPRGDGSHTLRRRLSRVWLCGCAHIHTTMHGDLSLRPLGRSLSCARVRTDTERLRPFTRRERRAAALARFPVPPPAAGETRKRRDETSAAACLPACLSAASMVWRRGANDATVGRSAR